MFLRVNSTLHYDLFCLYFSPQKKVKLSRIVTIIGIGMYEIASLQNIFVRRLLETSDLLEDTLRSFVFES